MLVILCRSTKKPFCASNASFQKSQEKLESHGGKVVPSCSPAASLQYAQNHYFSLLLPSKTNRRSTHSSKVNPNYQLLQSSHRYCQVPYPFFPATLVSFRKQLYRKWPTPESLVQIANQRVMAKSQKNPVSPTRAGTTTGIPQEGHFSVTWRTGRRMCITGMRVLDYGEPGKKKLEEDNGVIVWEGDKVRGDLESSGYWQEQ